MVTKNKGVRTADADATAGPTGQTGRTQRGVAPSIPLQQARILPRWPVPRDNEMLVATVGGLGQIGMNWTFYGHAGRWIGVDAGTAFPEDRGMGVDAIVPDPRALRHILGRLDGLIVTHAHLDHIGGINHFWPRAVNCPIYATPFAAALISNRLAEGESTSHVEVRKFEQGSSFEVGPFSIRTISVTHSIPEPVALAVTTPVGTIVHTGDFKLDPTPLLGPATDLEAFREVGDAGVMAMLCDSTNANRDLPITSEIQVREAFKHLFATRKGAVVVCCFASNVARMASAIMAADQSGRQVALAGRSMRNNEAIADELGMMGHVPKCLSEPSHLEGLDKRDMALVCTGAQGEERAALAKLAKGSWQLPKLGYGDTVVMSARVIPGNEAAVEKVLSQLRARGIDVIEARNLVAGYPVHVSGHAGRSELKTLHGLVRPRFAIPVHGEREHLEAHAQLAIECGAQAAPIVDEGYIMSVSQTGMKILGRVPVPHLDIESDQPNVRPPAGQPEPRQRTERTGPTMAA